MKVAGFSFIRNAVQYDYPIIEAIRSVLPLCDAFYLCVGASEDQTLKLVESIQSDKVIIMPTVWDEDLKQGGAVLAAETNKAFDAIPEDFDWCFYIQGDEVLHEKYIPTLQKRMKELMHDQSVQGLLFDYKHFYGSYDFIGDSRKWYKQEIRIIRNDKRIRSYKDAQGFRKDGQKLEVKKAQASIYHYGWVKHPTLQREKIISFNALWHDEKYIEANKAKWESFDYSEIDSLKRFEGDHPAVMKTRIDKMNWSFDFDPTQRKLSWKEQLSRQYEKWTGHRIGEYKNFVLLKDN